MGITPEDHSSWISHPCTKVLLEGLDLNEGNLEQCWKLGNFNKRDEARAQGQAFYIMGLREDIRHMLADKEILEDA